MEGGLFTCKMHGASLSEVGRPLWTTLGIVWVIWDIFVDEWVFSWTWPLELLGYMAMSWNGVDLWAFFTTPFDQVYFLLSIWFWFPDSVLIVYFSYLVLSFLFVTIYLLSINAFIMPMFVNVTLLFYYVHITNICQMLYCYFTLYPRW